MLAPKNNIVFAILLLLAVIPALVTVYVAGAAWLAKLEGVAYPVVEDVVITTQQQSPAGLLVYTRFKKARPCEFVSLTFYDRNGNQIRPDFDPDIERTLEDISRPIGLNTAGPWLLPGVRTLDGGRFYAIHRCHALWDTLSQFWP